MRNLVEDLLPVLETYRLKGIDAGPQAVYPFYNGNSLANLPASICKWLGIKAFGVQPLANHIQNIRPQEFQTVILFVIDGMGLNTLDQARKLADQKNSLAVWNAFDLAPLTSVIPSTTSTALTTFWTGRTPAEHGIVGFEVWLKEFNMIANMIYHNPASFKGKPGSLNRTGFNPETFLPVPVLGPHLRSCGVRPIAYQHHSIAYSGLSTMLLQDVDVIPYRSLSDLFVSLSSLLRRQSDESRYIYVYWGDLDEHSHHFGPDDERVMLEFETFSRQLGRFIQQQNANTTGGTLLLITADHGHLATPRYEGFELRRHPELMRCMVMSPSGEARLPYVYLRPGCEQRFLDYLEKTWPGQFIAVPARQAVESGLFGGGVIYERLFDRVGDYVLFPQGDAFWWFSDRDNPLLGRHGGLSRIEMLVPLLITVF